MVSGSLLAFVLLYSNFQVQTLAWNFWIRSYPFELVNTPHTQQFRALIPGPKEHVISTGRACFRVTRAICIRNREWTDFIRMISRSRKLICTRTDEFGLIIARVRAILNETGQTPYEDRVLVRKNYCMTYWQLEDTWLIYGLCQLIPCTEYVAGY